MLEYKNLNLMESTGRYLVSLLSAVINDEKIPALPTEITWENVYNMAKMHSVDVMAFYGAEKYISKQSELYTKWKKRRDLNLTQSLVQNEECKEIFKKFYNAGIRFLPLKGCELKRLYPKMEFRQMSDLDILIESKDAAEVQQIMENLGYETFEFGEKHDDEYFKYPYMHVEIHRQMLPDDVPQHNYYDDIWMKVFPDSTIPGSYKMTIEDFYIYQIAHFAKHISERGSGIRSLIDIYVYLTNFEKKMDKGYIEKELNKLNLREFSMKMELLSDLWFSKKPPKIIDNAELMKIQKNIFIAGAYGSREYIKAKHMDEVEIEGGVFQSLQYIFKRIFMSKEEFGYAYPITQKYPVLITFFWFYRIFDVLLHKRLSIKKEMELFWAKKKEK